MNGDGQDDLIVGSLTNASAGNSYVVFGGANVGTGGEFDLANLNGANGFRLDGALKGDFAATVAGVGDVNGDGIDDIAVGAHHANFGGESAGVLYVVLGATNIGQSESIEGFQVYGNGIRDLFGVSVDGAGDVNGDGFDDIVVGAPEADPNGAISGQAYIIFGFSGGEVTHLGTDGQDELVGSAGNDVMVAGLGDDELVGDAGNDVMKGAFGNDTLSGGSGSDKLFGGSGDDLFVFGLASGKDTIVDFAAGADSGDVVDLAAYGFADLDAVITQATTTGGDTKIQLDTNDSITLLGVKVADLHDNDFAL